MKEDRNYWEEWMKRRMSRRAMLRMAGITGLAVAGGSSLLACSTTEAPKTSAPTTAADRPNRGGTLKIAITQNWNILDPHTFYYGGDEVFLRHIFDYLVNYDDTLAYKPALSIAESWDIVDDVTILFKLRKGVKFTDGTEWNAQVLKANFDRITNKDIKSPRAYVFAYLKSVEYPDNFTCKIILKDPMASFLGELAHSGVGMASPANMAKWKNLADLQRNPVGGGPFSLTEAIADDHTLLSRNKDFWRKDDKGDQLPYLDGVRAQIIPDDTVRFGSLTTGQVDVNLNLVLKDVATAKADPNLQVQIQDGMLMGGAYWNLSRPPFNNLNFRRAVQYAINREAITKAYSFGVCKPYSGLVMPSAAWAFDPKRPVFPYDPVKAKQYLDQALAQGAKPEITLYVMGATGQPTAEMIQADLAKLGIKMNIIIDATGANRYWTSFEINFLWAGYTMAADPYTKMFVAHHSQGFYMPERKELGKNWDTPEKYFAKMDPAIEAANRTYDPEKRKKLLYAASDILDDQAGFLAIYYDSYAMAANKKVQGLRYGGDGRPRFETVWIKG